MLTKGLSVGDYTMKVLFTVLVSLLLVAVLPGPGLAGWYSYTSADGLAHEDIETILADHAGNIWFGGGGGVTRYDGVTWQTYQSVGFEHGLQVEAMIEDGSGNIWFTRYSDPPCRFDGVTWREYTTEDGLASDDVTAILGDSKGNVWFCTGVGLSRYDGTTWRTYTTADGLAADYVAEIAEDHHGNVWVWTPDANTVCRFDGVKWVTHYINPYPAGGLWPTGMLVDQAGRLWCVGWGGAARFDGTKWTIYTTADGLANDRVDAIAEDSYGNIWFATWGGVSRYDGASWRTYTTADGLVSDLVRTVETDHAGNLWFGTYYNVSRYDGASWRTYTTADGLASNELRAGLEDRSGNLWFGTYQKGVSRYDGTSWRTYTTANGLGGNTVTAIIQDRKGNLWFGTDGGASQFDGTNWRTYTTADGLGDNLVKAIAEDRFGNLWFGTYEGGASRFDGVTWKTYTTRDGLADMTVTEILEDHSGDLWFGTYSGVSRFDGTSWRTCEPYDSPSGYQNVTAMLEDQHGTLWFGLYGGLYRFDGASWRNYTPADGLLDDEIYAIVEDHYGRLWFGNRNGVSRYDGLTFGAYSSLGGIASYAVMGIFEDRHGRLWFCTQYGAIAHEADLVAPITVISPKTPALSTSTTHTIMFTAAYREIVGISFSYSFDGSPWSAWSPTDFWLGTDLSEGEHVFKVRARDSIGNVDSTAAVAVFEIDATPPTPMITSPVSGQAVRDSIAIVGTASDLRFEKYRIEARPVGAVVWRLVTESADAVSDGFLCGWNTLSLPEGEQELRLSVTDTLGLTGNAVVRVVIDNEAPWAYQTAPATVGVTSGGHIYTTDGEVHLYFPPHAFAREVEVRIDSLAGSEVPDTLESGVVRVLPGYEVSWEGAVLEKAATLAMSFAGWQPLDVSETVMQAPAYAMPALYLFGAGSMWRRVGGTVEEGGSSSTDTSGTASHISAAITEPGRYALFLEPVGTGASGASTLSALSLTPRVFSPSGTFANDHVAIGFTLGRAAPVTVKVYNRAGRLVRELVSGETMGAGANLVRWDGRDYNTDTAPDGLYLISVEAMGRRETKTISVVR